MRIIEKREFKDEDFTITCRKCFTVFAYTFQDTVSDRDGRAVKCPNCGQLNYHATALDYYNK